jgi:chromosome segregation ATPase
MESMPTSEMARHSLPEDSWNLWHIFIPAGLFLIFIPFVLLLLCQWLRNRKYETKQIPTEVQMNLQEDERFIQQLRAMTALMQESHEEDYVQLQSELKSLKEVRKVHQRHIDQYQNLMDLVKTIRAGDERLAELDNQMGLFEKAMEAQHERVAQMHREIQSMRMMVDRSLSVPTEQIVGDPASMKSLVMMR